MKEIHEMDVYRLAERLSDMVWDAYDTWDFKAQKTMGLQIIRPSDSIAANIVEGCGRYSPADRKRFSTIRQGFIRGNKSVVAEGNSPQRQEIEEYKRVIDELGPKLNAFINKTGK